MRNILALIGAATIGFLGAGWYLGWYQVSTPPGSQGKQSLNVNINSEKIQQDVKKGMEKGEALVDQFRGREAQPAADRGPATNFFTPTPALTGPDTDKGSSGGWKPIIDPQPKAENGAFGLRLPRN